MMAVFLNNGAQGSVATGPCDKAGHGQTQEKCTMKCNYDGSCTESVIVEKCGCSGYAEFQAGAANFQVSMSCTIIYPIYHCMIAVCSSLNALFFVVRMAADYHQQEELEYWVPVVTCPTDALAALGAQEALQVLGNPKQLNTARVEADIE